MLAWRSEDGNWVWTFVLEARNGTTRLISRNRFRLPTLAARLGETAITGQAVIRAADEGDETARGLVAQVGIDLGPDIYYVFVPLLFLVMLVPFTLNGLAVREAFFVSFLGSFGVGASQAFAAGFLYFLVTLLLAFPGALIMLREGLRGGTRPRAEHG